MSECVTLPSAIATMDMLIEGAREHYNARAVTNSFVESVRVIKEISEYYSCLQCWVCGVNDTLSCSSCMVAAFCGRSCQKKGWKKNHKVHCLHCQRLVYFAEAQCYRMQQALKDSFIAPENILLAPKQFFDYTMVLTAASMVAQDPAASLNQETVSMEFFLPKRS